MFSVAEESQRSCPNASIRSRTLFTFLLLLLGDLGNFLSEHLVSVTADDLVCAEVGGVHVLEGFVSFFEFGFWG